MNRKEFETELHKIDPKLILTVLAHRGADEIDYYDGYQKIYKVFDFRTGLYCSKGSLILSVNQFNQLRNLLLKAQAFIRGRNTFDDMSTVADDSHNAKKLKKYDNHFKEYTDKLDDVLYKEHKIMEVTIDAYIYDKLKDYCDRLNEPMSVIATKAIKKYIDVSD